MDPKWIGCEHRFYFDSVLRGHNPKSAYGLFGISSQRTGRENRVAVFIQPIEVRGKMLFAHRSTVWLVVEPNREQGPSRIVHRLLRWL